MAWPEVYTALDQGTIDGVDTNYAGMVDAKQYEVSKCLAVTDHIYTALVVMMNLKTFSSLSTRSSRCDDESRKGRRRPHT